MWLLDTNFATVNGKKPRNSDRIIPGEQMNLRGLLDAATNIPVVGDALSGGMAVYDAAKGNYGSAAMNALGVLPFVSGTMISKGAKVADAVGESKKLTKYEQAHLTAQKNAALPVEQGGLGLPVDNTAMDRARAMGFDMDVYHGSNNIDKVTEFDPSKVVDNVQYGGKFYTSTDPAYASKYADNSLLGDSQGVMPLMMKSGKRFDMAAPVSADDAASIMEQLGQYERADKIRQSGKPYRNGNELFYWGLDSSLPNATRGDAILRSGFDSIHGDPKLEIIGEAGKPHSVVSDPAQLRSRFAAFDPMRRHEADLLGYADPYLLGGIAGGGLLGLGGYKAYSNE